MTEETVQPGWSRRRVLGGAGSAALLGATSGCISRARRILSREPAAQVSLSLAAVPADADPYPIQIARRLRSHLDAIGASTSLDVLAIDEFLTEVLVNHAFDIAIGFRPADPDPDALYGTLHSSFGAESGWQNPYGFSDLDLDDLLEDQRFRSGDDRRAPVREALEIVAREQPFAPLCFPDHHLVARADRFEGFEGRSFDRAADLMALEPREDLPELRVTIGDTIATADLNPLSVEYRHRGTITGLLYDPLAVLEAGETQPWLAESLDWNADRLEIRLREVDWHDSEPVTAEDVAFTYRFLEDTTLGESEPPAPAPRTRSRAAFIEDVEVLGERRVAFAFAGAPEVARRALTVPILPEHVWTERMETAEVGGFERDLGTTEALVTDNLPAVGSGPYRYADHSELEYLVLERADDHFAGAAEDLTAYRPPADRLVLEVAPSDQAAIEGIRAGDVDLTLTPVAPDAIDLDGAEGAQPLEFTSDGFYHVMYNTRDQPLSNPRFRRIVSRLLDKEWLVEEVFDGNARPTATPIADEDWLPDELQWAEGDPEVPFFGDNGRLDASAAREAVLEAGYQYDEDGVLLGGRA